MATGTGANDGSVIDPGRRAPTCGDVTVVAGIGGIDVRAVFTRSGGAVMTTHAIASHTAVVEDGS